MLPSALSAPSSAGSPPPQSPAAASTPAWSSTPCTSTPTSAAEASPSALLGALITSTEAAGIWTIQFGIFPENAASLAVHRRRGFREIGTRERIGRHHGVWRDVVMIERRSQAST